MPPTFAKIIIAPLNMNKLDLRDYLYHAYDVHIVSVRSYIEQQKVTQGKLTLSQDADQALVPPRAIKKMTVGGHLYSRVADQGGELNYTNWNKEAHDQGQKRQRQVRRAKGQIGGVPLWTGNERRA